MAELPDAGTFSYQLVSYIADSVGDDRADAYLTETVREVMELAPAVKEAIVTDLLTELTEELHRRGAKDAAGAVMEVQAHWSQEG